jgi:hypothetical protein
MSKRLRILHLSDLHIGKEPSEDAWRVERVMGEAWARNLREIAADGPIDLVCFTGDLAQSGQPWQYIQAKRLLIYIEQSLKQAGILPLHDVFFCVPGNHDIDRSLAPEAWAKLRELQWHHPQALSAWMAGGKTPFGCDEVWRDCIVCRQQAYRDFLAEAGLSHLLPGQAGNPHPRLGYRRTLDLGLGAPLHIIGFDSAWLAGDDADAGNLRLTDDQIGRLMTGADGKPLPGWRIGLIHHPLTDLADARDAQRLLGEYGLDLLLHGHQHDPLIERWADPQASLHVFAAGCLYEHQRYPNGLLVVDVELPEAQPLRPRQVWARRWSHRRSEWIDDDDLYRDTRNGRLRLVGDDPAPFVPTPGRFVGREGELAQLRAALLPTAPARHTQPTLICCAIDGMPGVGKTRLAERFVSEHWLVAYPPPPETPTGKCVLRLMLATGEDRATVRSADDLLRDLAGRVGLKGSLDDLRRQLPADLQDGPGGRPRLVLIENVDSEAQAAEVAALAHGLPGCPILVTARVRKFGGQAWTRVEVAPLPLAEAVDLLLNEAAAFGEDAWMPQGPKGMAQAQTLAETLGRLPLALHIAASHLGMGNTPDEFLAKLRAAGLGLEPEQSGDHGLQVDRARAILRTSFGLSWATWCRGKGANPEWQQALVALAHGPAEGVGESLGAAIADLPHEQYGHCILAAGRLSLLEWEWAGEDETRERRVRLHALIAEFLRLKPVPDADVVLSRMSDWFSPLLSDQDPLTKVTSYSRALVELEALLAWLRRVDLNLIGSEIRYFFDFAISNGPLDGWALCFSRSAKCSNDEHKRFPFALAAARLFTRIHDNESAAATIHFLRSCESFEKDSYSNALVMDRVADLCLMNSDSASALRIWRDCVLPFFDESSDLLAKARIYSEIVKCHILQCEHAEAINILVEILIPIYQQHDDLRNLAISKAELARMLHQNGDVERALEMFRREVLPLSQAVGDLVTSIEARECIADILMESGDFEEAFYLLSEVIDLRGKIGDRGRYLHSMVSLARLMLLRGSFDQSIDLLVNTLIPEMEKSQDHIGLMFAEMILLVALVNIGDVDEDKVKVMISEMMGDFMKIKPSNDSRLFVEQKKLLDRMRESGINFLSL